MGVLLFQGLLINFLLECKSSNLKQKIKYVSFFLYTSEENTERTQFFGILLCLIQEHQLFAFTL